MTKKLLLKWHFQVFDSEAKAQLFYKYQMNGGVYPYSKLPTYMCSGAFYYVRELLELSAASFIAGFDL